MIDMHEQGTFYQTWVIDSLDLDFFIHKMIYDFIFEIKRVTVQVGRLASVIEE